MKNLTAEQVIETHRHLIDQTGGSHGIRDQGAIESSVAQPQMSFGGQDLYPTITEKAAALGFSLIQNHPFVDGNKRVGHAAMEMFLFLNGHEIQATLDEQEKMILGVAAGKVSREAFVAWIQDNIHDATLGR